VVIGRGVVTALAALFASACGDLPGDISAREPVPASLLERAESQRPEVLSVAMSGGGDVPLNVVVRFSNPMATTSVEAGLQVLAAEALAAGAVMGVPLEPAGPPSWSPDTREVFLQIEAPDATPVVVRMRPGIEDRQGRVLDGQSAPNTVTDAGSFHRVETDGFAGPATYVSLPFYVGGTAQLPSNPTLPMAQQRPGLGCRAPGASKPVSTGTVATDARGTLVCPLRDQRQFLRRSGVRERKHPRAWDPTRPPQAEYVANQNIVEPRIRLGERGLFPPRASWRISNFRGDTGVRLQGIDVTAPSAVDGVFVAPVGAAEPLWPVTGVAPPDTVWVDPVLHRSGDRTGNGIEQIRDDTGAWLADEFVGQQMVNEIGSRLIVSNTGTLLRLAGPLSCTPCSYTIRTRFVGRYEIGGALRLVADRWYLDAGQTLSGDVSFTLGPGVDLHGVVATDRLRDGDEAAGIPDDTITLQVAVP